MSGKVISSFALAVAASPAIALGAVAATSYSAGREGPNPSSIRVADARGGQVLTVKLAGLARDTNVHRARLRAGRGDVTDPRDLLVPVEIYPGERAAGKPLALVGPGWNAFEATDAVRAALAAGGELKLFVKAFPGWERESTRLEVMYDGKPGRAPPAVTGLKAFHRAGQTFLTWRQPEPLTAAEKLTWGEYKKALADHPNACTYRVYAHGRRIGADNLLQAELLGEVGPLSCWNTNGRNMEYLIGQAMQQSDEIGELARGHNSYMYTWGPNHPRMDRYPLDRFVVDDKGGPLAPGTGLYVASPGKPGRRYYAVVSCKGGAANTADFSGGNSLAEPVVEEVGPGRPVHQGPGLWGPFFDYPGRRQVYVQWCGPPLSPRENMYFNWSVLVPPGVKPGTKVQGELYFHTGNFSYAKPRKKFIRNSIQIAPHDWPFTGWYGFNDAWGTLKSYKDGVVRNHTQRRIVAFLDWAKKTFPLDPERIFLPGGDGAVMLALSYPDMFSYVLVIDFDEYAVRPGRAGALPQTWGPKAQEIKDDHGRGNWGWAMLDEIVLANRSRDLPLIFCRGYSWAPFERKFARGKGRFYDAMRKAGQPIVADWTWASGYLIPPDKYSGLWRGLDLTRTTPIPAFANCSTDSNKEGDGQTNLPMTWKPIVDAPTGLEAVIANSRGGTVDVAFRRHRKFRPKPGEKLAWEAVGKAHERRREEPPAPQSGTVVADDDGVFVLKGIQVPRYVDVTIKVTRAR